MKSYLIKDTTREEREEIVKNAFGNTDGSCDGCASGLADDMYQDYIDGKAEIAEINMRFRASYVQGSEGPDEDLYRRSCVKF